MVLCIACYPLLSRVIPVHRIVPNKKKKEVKWERSWFRERKDKGFWQNISNGKYFFDELAKEYHIYDKRDWNRITKSLISKRGGLVSSFLTSLMD